MAGANRTIGVPLPHGLTVEEVVCDGEELLLFSWTQAPAELGGLTAAERDVLRLVVQGESNAAIARARGSRPRTVANQVATLLRKTGAASRFELIRRFAGYRGDDR
jgi:DNA-binding NarL/FixJ family response regulator